MSGSLVSIIVPSLGESMSQATMGRWLKSVGDFVELDETIAELETDKVTLEINAPAQGVLESIFFNKGQLAKIGDILGNIEAKNFPKQLTETEKDEDAPELSLINTSALPSAEQTVLKGKFSERLEKRVPLSTLRQRMAERLKEAQNTAAILTTFNEVDVTAIQNLRRLYKDRFEKQHGVKLGLMSFFVKAVTEGLKEIPVFNSQIEANEIVHKNYQDIGIAVASPQGLVVPIIRDANTLNFAEIEKIIADFGERANHNKLSLEEISGGTFTITNGGVFGSLLSTPILNPPQSGILGLHKIQDRPIAADGRIQIRPMMYLALSYDHRLIDGKEAVTFLIHVKDFLENPGKILLDL